MVVDTLLLSTATNTQETGFDFQKSEYPLFLLEDQLGSNARLWKGSGNQNHRRTSPVSGGQRQGGAELTRLPGGSACTGTHGKTSEPVRLPHSSRGQHAVNQPASPAGQGASCASQPHHASEVVQGRTAAFLLRLLSACSPAEMDTSAVLIILQGDVSILQSL